MLHAVWLQLYMSRWMGKPTISIGENKGADQLRSNCEADQRFCFRYMDSTIPLLSNFIQNFKNLACFCECTGWFVSGLVGTPKCWFCHTQAHIIPRHHHYVLSLSVSFFCLVGTNISLFWNKINNEPSRGKTNNVVSEQV